MAKRCPHCQTRPLRPDVETCWYCGKEYRLEPKLLRPLRPHQKAHAAGRLLARDQSSLHGQAEASTVAR